MTCTLVPGGSVCLVGVLPHHLTAPARSVFFLPFVTTEASLVLLPNIKEVTPRVEQEQGGKSHISGS